MLSRPIRARGLKPVVSVTAGRDLRSRPIRARGLKPCTRSKARFLKKRRAPYGRVD